MEFNELISVCIPSFNNEKYIQATIGSILSQNYTNFELVICDDHSTDRTVEKVKDFNDERIRLYMNDKNLGITGNWNKVISLAKGKYIKLVCGDDTITQDCLQEQVKILESDSEQQIALVVSRSVLIDAEGRVIYKRRPILKDGLNNSQSVISKSFRKGTNIIGEPMAGMFRKSMVGDSLNFDGSNSYMIDLDFWFKLLQKGDLYVVPKYMAAFRVSGDSLSSTISFRQPLMFQKFIQKNYKTYQVSRIDLILGHLNSFKLGIIRNMVFWYFSKKVKR